MKRTCGCLHALSTTTADPQSVNKTKIYNTNIAQHTQHCAATCIIPHTIYIYSFIQSAYMATRYTIINTYNDRVVLAQISLQCAIPKECGAGL